MLTLLRIARLAVLLVWTIVLLPFQVLAVVTGAEAMRRIPQLFHRGVARVLGITVESHGMPVTERPVLFIANHSSWLDIVVLSTLAPVSFVAKSEIAGWPGISVLAKLQRSIFIERKRGQKTREGLNGITERLRAGDNIVLFAEGTAADGNTILPFKSALLSAAETDVNGRQAWVQPVAVAYTHLDGFPLGRRARHRMTWYGKMPLGPHLWSVFGNGHSRVVVQFLPPVHANDFPSRKELTAYCQAQITSSHNLAITGRMDSNTTAVVAADAEPSRT